MIKIDVIFPDDAPLQAALHSLADRLRVVLPLIRTGFISSVQGEIYQLLASSPEGVSLQGGTLQGQLGVQDPTKVLTDISSVITRTISWQVVQPPIVDRNNLKAEIRVGILESTLQSILKLPIGFYISENLRPVKWLEWLLTKGTETVIRGYVYSTKLSFHRSRTGIGTMKMWPEGPGWHVPEFAAGTIGDNWLTRSLRHIKDKAENIFHQQFLKYLS